MRRRDSYEDYAQEIQENPDADKWQALRDYWLEHGGNCAMNGHEMSELVDFVAELMGDEASDG